MGNIALYLWNVQQQVVLHVAVVNPAFSNIFQSKAKCNTSFFTVTDFIHFYKYA